MRSWDYDIATCVRVEGHTGPGTGVGCRDPKPGGKEISLHL